MGTITRRPPFLTKDNSSLQSLTFEISVFFYLSGENNGRTQISPPNPARLVRHKAFAQGTIDLTIGFNPRDPFVSGQVEQNLEKVEDSAFEFGVRGRQWDEPRHRSAKRAPPANGV